jgi:transcriptional regulator with XRE-family HTH domain
MTINELLKQARKDSGLTMEQVAEEADVSPASVCRYEKDDRKIPIRYLRFWILRGVKINWEDLEIENR